MTQRYTLTIGVPNTFTVVLCEVSNGLKSGDNRSTSHISSTLQWVSFFRQRDG
jgi:hypothetical protein